MNRGPLANGFEDGKLRAAAARSLQTIDDPPASVEPIRRGNRKRTAVVGFDSHDPVVVQVCAEMRWLRTEAAVLRRLHEQTTVPVPAVLDAGCRDGVAYMLTEYVAGEDLHERFGALDAPRRRAFARSFGSYLAEVHEAFRFDGYGLVKRPGEALLTCGDDWGSWFTDYARGAIERLPSDFEGLAGDLRALIAGFEPADSPPSRLYPWDFRPGNALLADGDIAAVLDWEAPLATPPSLSVAKSEYLVAEWYVDDPEPLRAAFREGYRSVRPWPSLPVSHRVAAIADTAVDSTGTVTNPRYPELDRRDAVAFHRDALERALADAGRPNQTAGRESD
jgi:hypothetical protein